jgi:hypothetical protein
MNADPMHADAGIFYLMVVKPPLSGGFTWRTMLNISPCVTRKPPGAQRCR